MADNSSTSSSKLTLLIKVAVVALIVVLGDFIISKGLEKVYFNQESGHEFKTRNAIEHVTDSILIFGSSRAYRHYRSSTFGQKLNTSCFNLGRMGQSLFYHLALQELIFERHSPRLIVLDVDPNELFANQTHYDRLSCLLPFYDSQTIVQGHLEHLRGQKERIKNLSSTYPYNSTIIASLRTKFVDDDPDYKIMKGYKPYKSTLSRDDYAEKLQATFKFDNLMDQEIDENKVEYLQRFIRNAKAKKIPVVVVVSPMLYKISNHKSLELIESVCKEEETYFINFYGDKKFSDYSLFYDLNHLSSDGADEFSQFMASALKRLHQDGLERMR